MTEQQVELPKQFIYVDYQPSGVRDTSIESFKSLIDSLPLSRLLVFRAIQDVGGKASNHQIQAKLGWSINRITPRVLELRQMGLIRFAGKITDKISGKDVCAWELNQ